MNIDRSPVGADAFNIGSRDEGSSFSANRRMPGRVQALCPLKPPALCSFAQEAKKSTASSAAAHGRMRRYLEPIVKSPANSASALRSRGNEVAFSQRENIRLFCLTQPEERVDLIGLRLR